MTKTNWESIFYKIDTEGLEYSIQEGYLPDTTDDSKINVIVDEIRYQLSELNKLLENKRKELDIPFS